MTAVSDPNDMSVQTCDNCGRDTKVLFPMYWKKERTHFESEICVMCLSNWVEVGQAGRKMTVRK